jgi:uncharacterized protein (TIGR02145 family)
MRAPASFLYVVAGIACAIFFSVPSYATEHSLSGLSKKLVADTIDKNLKAVYDLDSNKYEIIRIGKQYWFRENLRTTKYNDTSVIATGLNETDWKQTTKGAFTVYENNPQNDLRYGKLYNGYAVATGRLCPKGWHIPTDKEWKELETFLGVDPSEINRTGGRSNLAGSLKASQYWKPSEMTMDNKSGLSVLPAGTRNDVGDYVTLNQFAGFWTSTEYETAKNYLWYRHYYYNINELGRNYVIKNNGYSCRCIKDDPKTTNPNSKSSGKPADKPASKGPSVKKVGS